MPAAMIDPLSRCIRAIVERGHRREEVRTLFVPGRIEILGKHTDYCGGRSVTCAIDRGIHVAFVPHEQAKISAIALDLDESKSFPFSSDIEPSLGWANYPTSVARRLARNFPGPIKGATFAFSSTLPQAAGLSSSSALIISTFLVLDQINQFAARAQAAGIIQSTFELAEYLGTLENGQTYKTLVGDRGVGTFGGSEDHTAITLGRAGMLSVYSYSPTRLEREVAMPGDMVLAVASSGVIAEKTGAARELYNRASLLARQLVELWNRHESAPLPTLAAITRQSAGAADRLRELVRLHIAEDALAAALRDRLEHFQAESERIIPAAIDALSVGDLQRFGVAVDDSQRLAHTLLANQVQETIGLAAIARDCGAVAASSFGAGFGGSVWAMVRQAEADSFLSAWRGEYAARFAAARGATFFLTMPMDGTSRIGLNGQKA